MWLRDEGATNYEHKGSLRFSVNRKLQVPKGGGGNGELVLFLLSDDTTTGQHSFAFTCKPPASAGTRATPS